MNSRAYQKYNRYHNWWAKVEKFFIAAALLLFLVLYASQLLNFVIMQKGGSLLTLQLQKYEGKAIAESQTAINTGSIELTVVSNSNYENLQIYLNGEYYRNFNRKSITMSVKNNDIIEINGIQNEYPAKIKISKISDNILGLKLDEIINVNKNFVIAGRIRLR